MTNSIWISNGGIATIGGKIVTCDKCPCCDAHFEDYVQCIHVYGPASTISLVFARGCMIGEGSKNTYVSITSEVALYSDPECTTLLVGASQSLMVKSVDNWEDWPSSKQEELVSYTFYTKYDDVGGFLNEEFKISLHIYGQDLDHPVDCMTPYLSGEVFAAISPSKTEGQSVSVCPGNLFMFSWNVEGDPCPIIESRYPGVDISVTPSSNNLTFTNNNVIPDSSIDMIGEWGPFEVATADVVTITITDTGLGTVLGTVTTEVDTEVLVNDTEMGMYTSGDTVRIEVQCAGNFSASLVSIVLSSSWGANLGTHFEYVNGSGTVSVTDETKWEEVDGVWIWEHQICPKNTAKPGLIGVMCKYDSGEGATGSINVTVGEVSGDVDTCHVWGESKTLSLLINGVESGYLSTALISVKAYVDNSAVTLSNYLVMNDNTAISFGVSAEWQHNQMSSIWQHDVKAVGDYNGIVDLVFSYGEMEEITIHIAISTFIDGKIVITPSWTRVDTYVEVKATIVDENGDLLPRCPLTAGTVTYGYQPEQPIGALVTLNPLGGWGGEGHRGEYLREVKGNKVGIIDVTLTLNPVGEDVDPVKGEIGIRMDTPQLDVYDEPRRLHIYGVDKGLEIVADLFTTTTVPPLGSALLDVWLSVTATTTPITGSAYAGIDGLEMYSAASNDWVPLSFSSSHWDWTDNKWNWSNQVRAHSGHDVSNVSIVFTLNYATLDGPKNTKKTVNISVEEEVTATLDVPSRSYRGDDFTVTASAKDTEGGLLERLEGAVTVTEEVIEGPWYTEFITPDTFEGFDEGDVSCTGHITVLCTYTFRARYKGETLQEGTITIVPKGPYDIGSLVEAINERLRNLGSSNLLTLTKVTLADFNTVLTYAYSATRYYGPTKTFPSFYGRPLNEDTFMGYLMGEVFDYVKSGYKADNYITASSDFAKSGKYRYGYSGHQTTLSEANRIAYAEYNSGDGAGSAGNNLVERIDYTAERWEGGSNPDEEYRQVGYWYAVTIQSKCTWYEKTYTSDSPNTTAIEVKGTWKTNPITDVTFSTLGFYMPPQSQTNFTLVVRPGGAVYNHTAGSKTLASPSGDKRGNSGITYSITAYEFQFKYR